MSNTHHKFTHEHHHGLEEEREKMLEKWTENQSPNHEVPQEMEKTNFFIPKCDACKNEIYFAEGDVIYGDKWYHISCWKEPEKIKILSQ